jgi:cytochrome c-type biogenesis protein
VSLGWIEQFETIAVQRPLMALALSFIGGLLASFTPCAYPMLPITVAFVGTRSRGSRWRGFVLSSFYVLGLALVYSALGAFAALTGKMFGAFTSNPYVNLALGNMCLIFALVMLDAIHLPQPAFLSRLRFGELPSHDVLNCLLLGGASALVVTACTTPVLGVLLALVATRQEIIWGTAMLFVFAYGMGVLVIIVGTFTGLLTSLPRSGVWMRRVQKLFALLMILVAEYFFIKAGEFWL